MAARSPAKTDRRSSDSTVNFERDITGSFEKKKLLHGPQAMEPILRNGHAPTGGSRERTQIMPPKKRDFLPIFTPEMKLLSLAKARCLLRSQPPVVAHSPPGQKIAQNRAKLLAWDVSAALKAAAANNRQAKRVAA